MSEINSEQSDERLTEDSLGDPQGSNNGRGALLFRLFVGLVWGLGFFALDEIFTSVEGKYITAIRLIILFAPLSLIFGIGNIPLKKLLLWFLVTIIGLTFIGINHSAPVWQGMDGLLTIWLFSLIIIFIVHEFVQASVHQDKFIAPYHVYFDQSWHHGFQVGLALGFLGAFWIVLLLGAWLFNIIGLPFFQEIISEKLFSWIVSPIVFVLGVYLTDSGSNLTRGARQLGLTLLSWLAILMTIILIAFVMSLPFTGLEKLFATKNTTLALLSSAAVMVLLINAAFQVGDAPKSSVLRVIVRLSTFPLIAILGLATYGLWLRIAQYGLTPARVIAAAELIILAFYGIGYVIAALKPGEWLVTIKPVNLACAWLVVGVLFLLMMPVGDPARISVANQVARLDKGTVEPNAFDFKFLANKRSGKYGKNALAELSARTGDDRNQRIAFLAGKAKELAESGKKYYSSAEETYNQRRDAIRLVRSPEDWTGEPLSEVIPDQIILASPKKNDVVGECLRAKSAFDRNKQMRIDQDRKNEANYKAQTEKLKAEGKNISTRKFKSIYDYDNDGRCPARYIDIDFDGDLDFLIWTNSIRYNNRNVGISLVVFIRDGSGQWSHEASGYEKKQNGIPKSYNEDTVKDSVKETGLGATEYMNIVRSKFLNLKLVPRKHLDFRVHKKRYRLKLIGKSISPDQMRTSIEMEENRIVPAGLLSEQRLDNLIAQCAKNKSNVRINDNGQKCYGRYLDINGDDVEEFLVIKSDRAGNIMVNVYDFVNEKWAELGSFEAKVKTRSRASSDRLKEVERIIKSLQLLPPLTGDLEADDQKIYLFPK